MSVKACPFDRTPLVSTFEFPGAELYCLKCARAWGLFEAAQLEATDEQVRIQDHLTNMFRQGWRHGLNEEHFQDPGPPPQTEKPTIHCDGCGKDSGRTFPDGKPAAWYSRADRAQGKEVFACSRDCIELADHANGGKRVMVMPW